VCCKTKPASPSVAACGLETIPRAHSTSALL
jgi:hypothetical protein